ncbi:tRNA (adenosine(37)-N6)-dimethylallyltransferase MiaA [Desemzia sp. RIT804]|uniref:tRNA (adenosine(37)-N6)-dimethylallyltransferase MiaA n=1 Tax=Desemzia sp. RIT 804 TaxID=2810209 RepID=UPI00194E73BC|nr:tRNA (adenosine(37)-N6)-dimethylallyltransferase MiaA [Desemzia sp. RIT 804]MBM6614218.1 tRNA (adenosine(37)-N6)-dimethylallyltransferase MiaA [Desemzia sp. RIT 804]
MKTKILVIVGPTAVGKTNLSIEIAKEMNGEIISGDSMQIYKGLDIGTAKITPEEMEGIPHYLIDEVEPWDSYTVTVFQKRAKKLIQQITAKGKTPIIVGGTGLYIESLLYDVSYGGEGQTDLVFRDEKEAVAKEKGNLYLWEELKGIDPEAAQKIHYNNRRRVIRALEVFYVTGELFSSYQNERQQKESVYEAKIIGLDTARSVLYDRINSRVDQMVAAGLEKEAYQIVEQGWENMQAAKGIGYKEWFSYFKGEESIEDVVEQIKQNSRRYAKRQLTWFKNRMNDVSWWDLIDRPTDQKQVMAEVKAFFK